MSLKRICAVLLSSSLLLFSACTHVGTKVGNISKGGFATVVVDAGHGGKDNGGTSRRGSNPFQLEKNLTLDTAKRVRDLLRRSGFRVVMMRDGDYFVELDDRVARADKEGSNAILVSIHYNATANSSANGAETYFWRADSHGLATRIESHLASATGENYGGVIRRRLRLTRNPDIRCVLCECAYLTNPRENARVADPNARQRIAEGIANGIVEQSRLGDDGIPSVPEIWAPLSRAEDARGSGHGSHGHRPKRSQRSHRNNAGNALERTGTPETPGTHGSAGNARERRRRDRTQPGSLSDFAAGFGPKGLGNLAQALAWVALQ